MIGLALLLQINIIRALVEIDYNNLCFYCINESDIILGAITPIIAFVLITIKLDIRNRVKYVFDDFDGFFILSIIILFISSIYATNIVDALGYSLKFLLIGSSFYFISKIIVINTIEYRKAINIFFKSILVLSLLFGTLAGVLYLLNLENANRLTLPGVHPIPFTQLIGLGVLISFMIFITKGTIFNIKSKLIYRLNIVALPYLTLILFATNTRGVMLAVAVAVFLYLLIAKVKVKKRTLYFSGTIMLIALIVVINYIDFEVLFSRILWRGTHKSVDDRFIAYYDTFSIFLTHPFGIGPSGFSNYSILPYPHNLFLENMAHYGVFGLFLDLYLILIGVWMFLIALKNRSKDIMFVFLFSFFIYFFIETMFSFTLWMHKGLYLSIGFFAGYHYRFRNRRSSSVL
mgnify:CR=1 FL=1